MSNQTNDGGPAFPRPAFITEDQFEGFENKPQNGMSLRDYYAGLAMGAIISNQKFLEVILNTGEPNKQSAGVVAANALAMADAMIAARKETP